MTYRYRRYTADPIPPFGDILYRPAVPLHVSGASGSAWITALVDTGSDLTLLPREVGEAIGVEIDESPGIHVAGIGGQSADVVTGTVQLQLGHPGQDYVWNAAVGFINTADSQDAHAILGYAGCLEFFATAVDGNLKVITIIPTDSFPGNVNREQ